MRRVGQEVLDEGLDALYNIPGRISRSYLVKSPVPTGPWRGVMSAPNAFANECFLDEVAAALKQDPYEFRLGLLANGSYLRPVLELAATKANWGSPLSEGHGRGIAAQVYHKAIVAMVAEVSVQEGALRVHKVVCAIDCGRVIHPDMVAQQIEGSVVYGLTTLLKGEITYKQGRVQQSNFHDYEMVRIEETPEIDVLLSPRGGEKWGGMAQSSTVLVAPAVCNAIFAACGKRVRKLPLSDAKLG